MPQPLVHCVLIRRGPGNKPGTPSVLHLDVKGIIHQAGPRRQPVNLVVVDSQGMREDCQKAAFAEVTRLRSSNVFRHGVLVCDSPRLPLIVAAMRAGLRDVISEPLSARQLAQLLNANSPAGRTTTPQFAALAATLRAFAAPSRTPSERSLTRRENALLKRNEELQNQEARLTVERASLEEREQQLRTNTRRFERTFAAMQKDLDVTPPPAAQSAPPFHPELEGIAVKLAERTKALDIRERMLQELENILLGQLNGQPAHLLEVDTRPPFPMARINRDNAA